MFCYLARCKLFAQRGGRVAGLIGISICHTKRGPTALKSALTAEVTTLGR